MQNPRTLTLLFLLLIAICAFLCPSSFADIIALKDGSHIECVIISSQDDVYKIRTLDTSTCAIQTEVLATSRIQGTRQTDDYELWQKWDLLRKRHCTELTEEERKAIWREYDLIEKLVDETYPYDSSQLLYLGQVFELKEGINLMPELEPVDPVSAMQKVKGLLPGSIIKVLRICRSKSWYFVETRSPAGVFLGSGWVDNYALVHQYDLKVEVEKLDELRRDLKEKHTVILLKKFGITHEQLSLVILEGAENQWPGPPEKEAELAQPIWHKIAEWQGKGTKTTEIFSVPSSEWRINWNTSPGLLGYDGLFQVILYSWEGELISVEANLIGKDQNATYMRGEGSYYLLINASQNYTVTVEASY